MKKYIAAAGLVAGMFYACNQAGPAGNATDNFVDSINRFCPDTAKGNDLCSDLPYDINEKFGIGYSTELTPTIQPPFDIFSWQTFVALNWPADSKGNPIGNSIAANPGAPRVWESYPDIEEIFSDKAPLLLQIKDARNSNLKFFYRTSKSPHRIGMNGDLLDADGYPLIDRNLNFVVFSVSANPVEAGFISTNNLTTKKGIDSISVPLSPDEPNKRQIQMPASVPGQSPGSMEIKTAWRILDSVRGGDIPSRYYTRDAIIYISGDNSTSGQPFKIKAKVGLVGMHIIRKTGMFANWIWSTFEHIDNVPDNLQEAQMNQPPKYPWSFYYPSSMGLLANTPVDTFANEGGNYRFDSTWPYAKRYAATVYGERNSQAVFGTQAQRMTAIYYRTEEVNALWRKKLAGTVWANYKLIGSQWAKSTLTPGKPLPSAPSLLGNTTLETFSLTSASCIGCHSGAIINYNQHSIFTDFSFLLALHAK